MKKGGAQFLIYQDVTKEYRWHLQTANGKILADSGESFVRRDKCRKSIKRVKEIAGGAVIVDDKT